MDIELEKALEIIAQKERLIRLKDKLIAELVNKQADLEYEIVQLHSGYVKPRSVKRGDYP